MHFSFVPELCRHLLHLIIQFLTFFRSHYSKFKRSGAVVEPKTLNSSTELIPGWPHGKLTNGRRGPVGTALE